MSAFSYRQRVGNIDWRAITSVKTEEIALSADPTPLQKVLDIVTFCEFRPDDVKNNSIESVSKLVNILQFISEYLLHCQEAQYKAIRDIQTKSTKNKEQIEKIKKENLALKEDRKIYQRQLAMLRKSLGPDYFLNGGKNDNEPSKRLEPRVVNLFHPNEQQLVEAEKQQVAGLHSQFDTNVIDSILKHEEETRRFMATMLNDQKGTFLEQMHKITESIRTDNQNNESTQNSAESKALIAWTSKLQAQMEGTVKSAVDAMQSAVSQSLAAMANEHKKLPAVAATTAATTQQDEVVQGSQSSSSGSRFKRFSNGNNKNTDNYKESKENDNNVANVLQGAALEQLESELTQREAALERKENELQLRLRAETSKQQQQQTTTLAVTAGANNTQIRKFQQNAQKAAVGVICSSVKHGKEYLSVIVLLVNNGIRILFTFPRLLHFFCSFTAKENACV